MKKLVVLIAVATLVAGNSFAQSSNGDPREKISLGVKVGANYSNVYDSEGEQFNADPKFGLATGVFLAIPIGKYLGVQPEVLFSQKGFQGSGSILGDDYSFTRTTSFIDVPLLFAFKPSQMITIVAGPQYSYLVKEKYVFESDLVTIDQEEEFKNDNIRKNILCFLGGIDFNLSSVVIGTRVGWDLQTNKGDGTSTTPRYKNMWYQATIGFKL
ncbi:MAG: porin family protein [Bacteroidales bacterium]|nr:porin family protein [Bacteroidales bacterium]